MKVVDRKIPVSHFPQVFSDIEEIASIKLLEDPSDIHTYRFNVLKNGCSARIEIKWRIAGNGLKGSWTSGNLLDKRIRADWELPMLKTHLASDLPLVSLFDQSDYNIITFGVSDMINEFELEAAIREEDNDIYCIIGFDVQASEDFRNDFLLRLDYSKIHFSEAVDKTSNWMTSFVSSPLIPTWDHAKLPVYSTWYAFHQKLDEKSLLAELKLATQLGYKTVIIDDGWQTDDDGRGYAYTGDWESRRFENIGRLVSEIHELDMKAMLWYSVPFCGKNSNAYNRFKGKFLTEKHPWAPVFDPRFSEVRSYLVSCFRIAVEEWDFDGLKLDFIDEFKIYPESEVHERGGRDTLNLQFAVRLLLVEISQVLSSIKSELLIEFRQKYINPELRVLGNMFRAFDCPADLVMNRVRTSDLKLTCGDAAVHSDMITWRKDERVEWAALQMTSILFSVPQISVKLLDLSSEHRSMINFYLSYWLQNRDCFLGGKFKPYAPLSNYPLLRVKDQEKVIYGIYDRYVISIEQDFNQVDIINGSSFNVIYFELNESLSGQLEIFNCLGEIIEQSSFTLTKGLHRKEVPIGGIFKIFKN